MSEEANIFSLETALSLFFDCITKDNSSIAQTPFLQAMTAIFRGQMAEGVMSFALDDESTAKVIALLKENLSPSCPDLLKSLNMPLTYL